MVRLGVLGLIIAASAVVTLPTGGAAQQSGVAAAIRTRTCDQIGDIVAPLVDAVVPAGDLRGNAAALPAANTFTIIPLSLTDLADGDHAIAIPFPATRVRCLHRPAASDRVPNPDRHLLPRRPHRRGPGDWCPRCRSVAIAG